MNKKLPKEIYVIWDQPAPNDPDHYLLAASTKADHASMGDKKIVGTYRLVQEDEVTGVVQVMPTRTKRR